MISYWNALIPMGLSTHFMKEGLTLRLVDFSCIVHLLDLYL